MNDSEFMWECVSELVDDKKFLKVSEWAEERRYLPKSVTSLPGLYDFDVAPYLREIADCLSVDSPVREFDFMKSVQIGATVGIFENFIGYNIEHVKTSPMMLLTADDGLAKLRMDTCVMPMIDSSGLSDRIRSSDESNSRKTGNTTKKLEWMGGGYLIPFGAKNADKMRSLSIKDLLEDECDTYPERVGKDGDVQELVEDRTTGYYETRKIGRASTPLLKGSSRIAKGFYAGDQRRFNIPCVSCDEFQILEFRHRNKETGEFWGLEWKLDEHGNLVPGSTRYRCKHCGHLHRNADKSNFLVKGKWVAESVAAKKGHVSYHINALYSPVGMLPWDAVALKWIKAWDDETSKVKDVQALQVFYNNMLGLPFEMRGAKIAFEAVSAHRIDSYNFGQIPNYHAQEFGESKILVLSCTVDVHKSNLAVSVMGHTRGKRNYVIDYWRFEDEDCTDISSPVWKQLKDLILEKEYKADDGTLYSIHTTLVDAGYMPDVVVEFCSQFETGVYPILGRSVTAKNATVSEFSNWETKLKTQGFKIIVNMYKDRLAPVLRRDWSEEAGKQRANHFNAPGDMSDAQIKELTVETREKKTDKDTGKVSYVWKRPGNAPNELWDLTGYNLAALDIIAWDLCINEYERESVDWDEFYTALEGGLFFREG